MKFLILASLFVAISLCQNTDFGTFCYPPQSCSTNEDCFTLTACKNGTCQSTLPGAPCSAAEGCDGEISTCRGGKCVLSNTDPSTFIGCTCDALNGCPANQKCSTGLCRTGLQTEGQTCFFDGDCTGSSMFCQNSLCRNKTISGDSCYDGDDSCVSGHCVGSICIDLRPVGDVCMYSEQCVSTAYCSYNLTESDFFCTAKVALGQPCSDFDGCLVGKCSFQNLTCLNKLLLNDTCYLDSQCASGMCVQYMCATARLSNGANCSMDSSCISGHCSYREQICRAPYSYPPGIPCAYDADCQSAFCNCGNITSGSSCYTTDYVCLAALNKTAGQSCYENRECVLNHECARNKCTPFKSVPSGGNCSTTRVCLENLVCDQTRTCVPDTGFCLYGAQCASNHACNCTGPANNRTMACVPTPAGYVNYFASSFDDPFSIRDQCGEQYITPYLVANFPQECDFEDPKGCSTAMAKYLCCTYCRVVTEGINIPIGFGLYNVDCQTFTLTNRTQSCTSNQVPLRNCDTLNPTTGASPADRLNAMMMFVCAAIMFIVGFVSF